MPPPNTTMFFIMRRILFPSVCRPEPAEHDRLRAGFRKESADPQGGPPPGEAAARCGCGRLFLRFALSYLQRHQRQGCQQQRENPETDDDLGFEYAFLLIVVVYGRHEENPASLAVLALRILEVGHLQHHRAAFDQEDAAQQRQQQLLADAEGEYSDDAADGERTRVAHEDLRRKRVVPQKAHQCADHGERKDHQLAALGDVHDIEVVGIDDVAREVGQHGQHHDDRHRDARHQTVEAVGEVGAVRHGRHHQNGHQHVEQPRGDVVAAGHPAVVELVVLDEGDGRLGGFGALGAEQQVLPDALFDRTVGIDIDGLDGLRDLLAHRNVGRKPHGGADDDAQSDLPHDLEATLEPLLAVAEDLDVVVQTADQPEPHGRHEQQLDVDVVQAPEQQRRHQNGQQDDQSAHGGGAALLELSFEPQVADLLADLLAAQEVDDRASEDDGDEQRKDDGPRRTERNVLEHARTGKVVGLIEITEQMVEHNNAKLRIHTFSGVGSDCEFGITIIYLVVPTML